MTLVSKIYRDQYCEVKHMADEVHHGLRLDQFVNDLLESFSREIIKRKIKAKEIMIEGRPGNNKPSSIIHHKDIIIIKFYKQNFEDEYWRGEKLNLKLNPDIVYEDDNLLVISKPPFMSTHPAGRHLFNCATVYFEMKYQHTIFPLHRIDRETSGILMLGKNSQMAQEMGASFEDDDVKKCYLFIAKIQDAYNGKDYFEANERLLPAEDDPEQIASKPPHRRTDVKHFPQDSNLGKMAKTYFYILEKTSKYVIGIACPQTGRQHQIRVHAKAHGIPLIGDKLYLGSYELFQKFKDQLADESDHDLMELPRHALHAIALKIPYRGQNKIFMTQIPEDFKEWILKKTSINILDLEEKIKATANRYYSSS